MYYDYSHGRQTLAQISRRYGISEKTIQKTFDDYSPLSGEIRPITKPVHIFFDATFFGRKWGVLVFRSGGKNVYWKIIQSESKAELESALDVLDEICVGGYTGFTIDGKPGFRELLAKRYNVPVFMCLFHQQQIIRRYTTMNPRTECGQMTRRFSLSLSKRDGRYVSFAFRVLYIINEQYLKERNEKNKFKHKRLRSAFRSLKKNLPYLCLKPYCPLRTTNTCEGAFSHWKSKVKIHRKLRFDRKIKLLNFLLAHDSISIF